MRDEYGRDAYNRLDEFFELRPDIAAFIAAQETPRLRTKAMFDVVTTIAGIRGRNLAAQESYGPFSGRPFEDFPSLTVFMRQIGIKGEF